MRQSSKVQGTKIAQAAKDLNVTSVTIRRYLCEFDIQTTTDANGIKVLPDSALEELKEVRRLKEDGLTNPKVMETLEEMRAKSGTATAAPEKAAEKKKVVAKAKRIESKSTRSKSEDVEEEEEAEAESDSEEEEPKAKPSYAARRIESKKEESSDSAQQESEDSESAENGEGSENGEGGENGDALGDKEGRVKHSLTCQTCSKVFEHMNPKLRDCLDCYRTKRKERRRDGSDRHKTVIQHPIAQQAASKMASQQQQNQEQSTERTERTERPAPGQDRDRPQRRDRNDRDRTNDRERGNDRDRNSGADRNPDRSAERDRSNDRDRDSEQTNFNAPAAALNHQGPTNQPMVGGLMRKVRSYRKAIEDTRQITGSLKRRLERPDLPEGERRWLEQIYAYQLILHQGWRHLSEYRMATQQQGKDD